MLEEVALEAVVLEEVVLEEFVLKAHAPPASRTACTASTIVW